MAKQGQIVSKKTPSLMWKLARGLFLVRDIELVLNSPLLSHILYLIVKKEVFYIVIIHRLSY